VEKARVGGLAIPRPAAATPHTAIVAAATAAGGACVLRHARLEPAPPAEAFDASQVVFDLACSPKTTGGVRGLVSQVTSRWCWNRPPRTDEGPTARVVGDRHLLVFRDSTLRTREH
jgi:hypothetical protein